MAEINGVEDSFIPVIAAERRERFLIVAIFNLVFDKKESGLEVVDCFLRLLFLCS